MGVWVDSFKVGDLVAHPKHGNIVYTEAMLTEAITNFRELRAKGYSHAVLREHGTKDPFCYGEIHDLRIKDGYFQSYVEFHRYEERKAYNDGILREFSPGFAHTWTDPHSGGKRQNVLVELSFTPMAWQRNLRAPQDTNPNVELSNLGALHVTYSGGLLTTKGEIMAEEKQPVEEPQAEELVEPSEQEVPEQEAPELNLREAFESFKAEILALLKPAEAEPVALSDDQTRIQNLEAEVDTLKADKTRLELSAKGIPADRVESLVQMSAKLDAEEFAKVVEYSRPTATVQAEIGATGAVEAGVADTTANELVQLAAKNGVSYGNGLTAWAHENHPDRINEILEAARH